jgi:16S rRNA (cytosine967-C5)-methyltransferase
LPPQAKPRNREPASGDPGVAPRAAALLALESLAQGRPGFLDEAPELTEGLAPIDAALAREIALGACAWSRLYDWLADAHLRPGEQPLPLRLALRVIAHQLFALDRVPPHAAVSTVIAALHRLGASGLTGVANAVGRKLAAIRLPERMGDGPLGRVDPAVRPSSLGVAYGLPDLLIDDVRPLIDGEDPGPRLAALGCRPALCTRSRPGAPATVGRSILRREGPWTWWGDPLEALRGPVSDGRAVVQDRAQGRVAEMVLGVAAARPGDLILDCCASPGGKALALADAGLRVLAADVAIGKVHDLPDTLSRLVQDGGRPALSEGCCQVVLVDAPCSNSGVLGRRPEARHRYDRAHRDQLVALQRRLLSMAATLVAPGGRLVYSTCSISPQENQGVAHALAGWRLLGERLTWPDSWEGGGYVAALIRAS